MSTKQKQPVRRGRKELTPFNVELLELTEAKLRGLGRTTSLDYFDNVTGEFTEDGLFSLTLFGPVGDVNRKRRFAYIDVKVPIFHPVIYKSLINLRRFYEELIRGNKYARFDEEEKDFVETDPSEGETGFSFFVRHWEKIDFKRSKSASRNDRVDLIEQYQRIALSRYVVVLPAGLRDMEVGTDGRPVSDESNDFYRKLISISNTIPDAALRGDLAILDTVRLRAQTTFNQLYDYFEDMIKGKKKLFMGKFASRNVQNSTRNVISSMIPQAADLDDEKTLGPNNSMSGIYQTCVMLRPVIYHRLLNGILSNAFIDPSVPVRLINKDTLQQEDVSIDSEDYDEWTTTEGLDKVLYFFKNQEVRHEPVVINNHYLALVYVGPDPVTKKEVFKVFYDIRELPDGFYKKYVRPITLAELLYFTIYPIVGNYPVLTTRYPVSGADSIYPSFIYLRTTTKVEERLPLNDQWEVYLTKEEGNETSYPALEYPVIGQPFFDTFSVSLSKLGGLGGDYDGDTVSTIGVYSKNAMEEIKRHLETRQAYIGTDGEFKVDLGLPPIESVLFNLTGEVK